MAVSPFPEVRLIEVDTGRVIAERTVLAKRWWDRLRGLIGLRNFPPGSALVLDPCSAIHTFGMRFPIDVLFLDRRGVIRCTAKAVRPWRIGPVCRSGVLAVELPCGTIDRYGLRVGQRLALVRASGECAP